MSNPSQSIDSKSRLIGLFFLCMAVLLVSAVLCRAPGRVLDGLPLAHWSAVAPFGYLEVVAVHVFSGLPICWLLAARIRPWFGVAKPGDIAGIVLLGGLLAVATLYLGGTSVLRVSAGGRFWLRIFWVAALQLPWCVAAACVLRSAKQLTAETPLPRLGAAVFFGGGSFAHGARWGRGAKGITDRRELCCHETVHASLGAYRCA